MTNDFGDRRGFTLIELLVTVIIIGVLAAIGVPQYLQTVENGKADDAVATLNMIGTTNKMFALDHNGVYASGQLAASCGNSTNCCDQTTVNKCDTTAHTPACELVWCNYLADQNWTPATSAGGSKAYNFYACDGSTGGGGGGGNCANGLVSSANRNAGTDTGWFYTMTTAGAITASGGAPAPSY